MLEHQAPLGNKGPGQVSHKSLIARNIFLKYDMKKQGYFTVQELKAVAKNLGEKIDDEELSEMVSRMNPSGKVSFEDFYNSMTEKLF